MAVFVVREAINQRLGIDCFLLYTVWESPASEQGSCRGGAEAGGGFGGVLTKDLETLLCTTCLKMSLFWGLGH